MGQVLHGSATTTEAIRRAMQRSEASARVLARRDGISPRKHTVSKWRPHWHVQLTPMSSSWLNQVECFFALLTAQQIRRGVHQSVGQLEAAIMGFIDQHNADSKPFRWTKSYQRSWRMTAGMSLHLARAAHQPTRDTNGTGQAPGPLVSVSDILASVKRLCLPSNQLGHSRNAMNF